MRATLGAEIRAFLAAHGPATSSSIALGVRARRKDVDEALADGPFARVQAPEGSSGRGRYWGLSQLVPLRRGGESRAALMLGVLRDGRWHSRREIWEATGKFFLTNNAANELRRRHGYDVEYDRTDDAYRLVSGRSAAA